MKWSFSGTKVFKQCPRKWYYQYVLADARSKDVLRQEAAHLKRLSSVQAWRGKLVDTVISTYAVPRLNRKEEIDTDAMVKYALKLGDDQVAYARNPPLDNGRSDAVKCYLFDIEYGRELDSEKIEHAKTEVMQALRNFAGSNFVKEFRESGSFLISQRMIQFKQDGTSIRCTPDLIAFYSLLTPTLVDWKVQASDYSEHWQQLAVYAYALAHINPHSDFPKEWAGAFKDPTRIRLVEYQLLQNKERTYTVDQTDLIDIEDFIYTTSNKMHRMLHDRDYPTIKPQDVPTTTRPSLCLRCPFRKICWGVDAA